MRKMNKARSRRRAPVAKAGAEREIGVMFEKEEHKPKEINVVFYKDNDLLNTKAAAKVLDTTEGTLNTWRCVKRYPLAFVKIGRSVKYRYSDLLAFISSRRVA